MHPYRTHSCGELRRNNVGQTVRIAGWIQHIRDLGGVLFMTLRDTYGITQVIIPSEDKDLQRKLLDIPRESTVTVLGRVLERPESMINPQMTTGEIEICAEGITALGKVRKILPFEVWPDNPVNDELRLKNRFLDLRKERLHNNLKRRSDIIASIRKRMRDENFIEIQTPILTSSSPEGARDFLVPSRLHPGKFYALPQAPQQFKQLIMVSGYDRYFQIAPCFRDEDARADRSPGEFYQLDLEMAFATQEDVFAVIEKILHGLFREFSDWTITDTPFPRIPYNDALLKYGTDKPDLRNPLVICDVSDLFKDSSFKVFSGKTVRVFAVSSCGDQPRSFFDKLSEYAVKCGGKGLAYLKVTDSMEMTGPISKFITEEIRNALTDRLDIRAGSALFFIADENETMAAKVAGMMRTEIAQRLDIIDKNIYKFCWIVDFPMFERDPETQKIDFSHNPFSMPQGGLDALNRQNPLSILAYQYDIVVNGVELSSGAVRNHDPEIMVKAFEIAGYDENEVQQRFPALFNAFQYGAPPHAGIAPGIDRIVMLLLNEPNIREVIAFPMNTKAQDLLMNAPNIIKEEQLKDVHIKIVQKS